MPRESERWLVSLEPRKTYEQLDQVVRAFVTLWINMAGATSTKP